METTVPNGPPEREPELPTTPLVHFDTDTIGRRTACGLAIGDLPSLVGRWTPNLAIVTCPLCAAILVDLSDLPKPAPVVHYDLDRIDQHAACGYDLDVQGPDAWSANPARVTCRTCVAFVNGALVPAATSAPVADPVVAQLHSGPAGETIAAPAESMAGPTPPIGATPPPAERRTVGLEVLTDELRADEDARRRADAREASAQGVDGELVKPDLLPTAARVGIVLRLNGEAVAVPETDADWRAEWRLGPDLLAKLLTQARFYADDHAAAELLRQARMYGSRPSGDVRAELLMPTPDVLAALAGQPARLLTAPVHVLAMDIQAGMLLYATDDDGDGAETLELVSAERDCTDADCIYGATCVVLTVNGHDDPDVHFNGYARIQVRIPAVVAR